MESKIVIIGGGISGLSLAYHLEALKETGYVIFETQGKAGGLCASYKTKNFTFDNSGHLLHISTKNGLALTQKLLGKNAALLKRKAYVHIYDTELPFPFQNNLYGLPENLVSECVKSALVSYKEKKVKDTELFKNWAKALYGEAICKHFMYPYNRKLWQTDLNKLTSSWCGKFVPATTLEDIIKGAYTKRKKDFGYNAYFFYPKAGGCQAIIDALLKKVKNIKLKTEVTEIDLKNKTATAGKKKMPYTSLISTMPLNKLGVVIKNLPAGVKKDFDALKHNSVYTLNMGFTGKTKEGHWYYFSEDKYPFFRAGVQSSFASTLAENGTSSLYVDFAAPQGEKPDLRKLEVAALKDLKKLGFIDTDAKIITKTWVEIPIAYPVYDLEYAGARQNIIDYLNKQNIYLLGRYGNWEYSFMEKSLLDGADLAMRLVK